MRQAALQAATVIAKHAQHHNSALAVGYVAVLHSLLLPIAYKTISKQTYVPQNL